MDFPKAIEDEIMELPRIINNLNDDLKSEMSKNAMFEAIINGAMGEAGKKNKYIKLGLQESQKKVDSLKIQIEDAEEKLDALRMQQQYKERIKPSI